MTDTEVYDKFFIDEEYDLENAPTDIYSYRSGWNNALKRASILVRDEIMPHGKWEEIEGCFKDRRCSNCKRQTPSEEQGKFCINCGAKMDMLDYKVINRGKCMMCGKELTEGLFFCKECEEKGRGEKE